MFSLVAHITYKRVLMETKHTTYLEKLLEQRLSYIAFLGKQQEGIIADAEIRKLTSEQHREYTLLGMKIELESKTCRDIQKCLRITRLPVLI